MRRPIIFIGMHRSGTSLLGGLLAQLGLFVGFRKDENNEALFFQRINDWLLRQSGATWDRPLGIQDLWAAEAGLPWTETYIKNVLSSPRVIEYLGLRRYLAGGIDALNAPWGWKDPRSTFTLPMWLRIFPQAKVICIERHGVDVAESLRARNLWAFERRVSLYKKHRFLAVLRSMKSGFIDSPRCASLEGGFALWQEYFDQARRMVSQLPSDRVLVVEYAHLLEDPIPCLRAAAGFCGLEEPETALHRVVAGIRPERGALFRSDADLRQFAAAHEGELSARGYDCA